MGSQEKTLKIESPPSEKHLWTTSTPEPHPFVFTSQLYVSVHFNLILPYHSLKQPTLVAAWAIASCFSGLPIVTSQAQQYRETKPFRSGRMSSGHLLLIRTHRRTISPSYSASPLVSLVLLYTMIGIVDCMFRRHRPPPVHFYVCVWERPFYSCLDEAE